MYQEKNGGIYLTNIFQYLQMVRQVNGFDLYREVLTILTRRAVNIRSKVNKIYSQNILINSLKMFKHNI